MGDTMKADDVVVKTKAGSSLISAQPVFSYDSQYVICCSACWVKVYGVQSGECVHNLTGHTQIVTCVCINPNNRLQVFSSSLDKTIKQWDISDGVLLKTYTLSWPLHALWLLGGQDVIVLFDKGYHGFNLAQCKLTQDEKECPFQMIFTKRCHKDARCTAIGCNNEFICTLDPSGATLTIKMLNEAGYENQYMIELTRDDLHMTCVTCHPTDECVVTGDSAGKITLWRSIFKPKKLVKTLLHWHAIAVTCLAFTTEGSYLLSGGSECVLVKWHYNSEYKDFLPRLGAPLNHITCSADNTLFATSHIDNSLHIISNSFKSIQTFQGLILCDWYKQRLGKVGMERQLAHAQLLRSQHQKGRRKTINVLSDTTVLTGMQIDPRTKCLVMNGRPGHLQFYSLHDDKQLYNLDIVGQNYISPDNNEDLLTITEITHAVFSSDGGWLVTAEMWDDAEFCPEIKLKFWLFNITSQTFELNTLVHSPHEASIVSVQFRPQFADLDTPPTIVTTSMDGKFKIWMQVDDTDIYRENIKWSCESTGYYRDCEAGVASFAEDGSLLAVAFGSVITIWDPDTNALKITLGCHSDEHVIIALQFGRYECCHLLVSVVKEKLTVWNLLTRAVQWSVHQEVSCIVADRLSSVMAVFTPNKELYVFQPLNPDPVYSHSQVSKSEIISAVFVPQIEENQYKGDNSLRWQNKSQLYFLTEDLDLLMITTKENEAAKSKIVIEQHLPQSTMKILMAGKKTSGVKDMISVYTGNMGEPGTIYVKEMLSTAPHVLPPVSSLCATFLQTLLINKHCASIEDMSDDDEDEEKEEKNNVVEMEQSSDADSDIDVQSSFKELKLKRNKLSQSQDSSLQSSVHKLSQSQDSGVESQDQSVDISVDLEKVWKESYSWML